MSDSEPEVSSSSDDVSAIEAEPILKTEDGEHRGDLILSGNDVMIVENCTFSLYGQLLARGNSKLILRNAVLFVDEKGEGWVPTDLVPSGLHIALNDSAVFELHNSTLEHPASSPCGIGLFRGSRVSVASSNLSKASLWGEDNTEITLEDSSVGSLEVARGTRCEIFGSNVSYLAGISYYLEHRYICQKVVEVWEDCSVEVWDSTIGCINLPLKDFTPVTISEPLMGYHGHWNTHDFLEVDGWVFNLTLHETDVTGKWALRAEAGSMTLANTVDLDSVWLREGSLEARNCTHISIGGLENTTMIAEDCLIQFLSSKSDTEVKNCRVKYFDIEDAGEVSISQTEIGSLTLRRFTGSLILDDALVTEVKLRYPTEADIEGTIRFRKNSTMKYENWDKGNINRIYSVKTRTGNRTLPNVNLTLYRGDEDIWTGSTDHNGDASFNVSFYKLWKRPGTQDYLTNYNKEHRLEATWQERILTVDVEMILTETPIDIDFEAT